MKYNSGGVRQWVTQFESAVGSSGFQVMVNPAGEAFVFGQAEGNLHGEISHGGNDCYLAKFDVGGSRIWTKLYGTAQAEGCLSAAVGADGSIYFALITTGSYGGHANQGSNDVVAVKTDAAGGELWSVAIATPADESAYGTAVDASGNFYITGPSNGDFHGLGSNPTPGTPQPYTAKVSASGTLVWISQFGSTAADAGAGITVSADGIVYVVGYSNGTIDGISNQGDRDAYVARLNADGSVEGFHYSGGTGRDYARRAALTSTGRRLFVAGWTATADGSFFGTSAVGHASFLMKFDF